MAAEAAGGSMDVTGAAMSRAEEIRAKLDTGSLSANQRKKYRKKLSKLFQPDDTSGGELSAEVSGMVGETASGCTLPAQGCSLGNHVQRTDTPASSKRSKRQLRLTPEGECSALAAAASNCHASSAAAPQGPTCPGFHYATEATRGESDSVTVVGAGPAGSAAVHVFDSDLNRQQHQQRGVLHEPAQPGSAPQLPHQQPPHLPHPRPGTLPSHFAAAPHAPRPHAWLGHRSGAPHLAPNLSGVFHLIAREIQVLEAAPAPLATSVVGRHPRHGSPCPSAGRSFCRVNMSQELSVISAELSVSVARGGQLGMPPGSGGSDSEGDVQLGSAHRPGGTERQQRGHGPGQASGQRAHGQVAGGQQSLQRKRPRNDGGEEVEGGGGGDGVEGGLEADGQQGHEQQTGRQVEGSGKASLGGAKKRKMFIHGNYHNYYGYRALGSFEEDPRLKLFQGPWFQGREMLDIGCNEGLVTLAVAAGFSCSRTTGVDIDAALIKRANSNLREMRAKLTQQLTNRRHTSHTGSLVPGHASRLAAAIITGAVSGTNAVVSTTGVGADPEAGRQAQGDGSRPSVSGAVEADAGASRPSSSMAPPAGPLATWGRGGGTGDQPPQQAALRQALKALSRTRFKNQDWSVGRSRFESYDTIMCLSVTKWVHLNGGDVALKRLFKKMFDSLTPGGLLVLEPQPWRSYRSAITKRQTCEVPFRRIEQLQLRPEGFLQHLTEVVGFVQIADLNTSSTAQHFDRPLYVLQRPPGLPRQVEMGGGLEQGDEDGGEGDEEDDGDEGVDLE